MTHNDRVIAQMAATHIQTVKWWMDNEGFTYAQALAKAKQGSCAGPGVWAKVEEHFA